MPLNSSLPLFTNRIDRFSADVSFNLQRLFKKRGKHTVCALRFLYGICEVVSRTAIDVSRLKKVKQNATLVDYQLSKRRRKHCYLYGTKILASNALIECITTVWAVWAELELKYTMKKTILYMDKFTEDCLKAIDFQPGKRAPRGVPR